MKIIEDRYQDVTIDNTALPESIIEFQQALKKLLNELTDKKLLWIKLPPLQAKFIPILAELDFQFHHCIENHVMLVKKLIANPIVPNAMNFNTGVGAVVLNEGKLLVIKDRFSIGYKLPGGHIDPHETIEKALVREVYEETGVKVTFESIINIGHFLKGQFGEQNLYIVCTAKNISTDINIHDSSEIVDAKWIDVAEFLACDDVYPYNKIVVKAVVNGEYSQLKPNPLKLSKPGEVFL